MKQLTQWMVILTLLMASGMARAQNDDAAAPESKEDIVTIALLLPLSGEWKALGDNLRAAAELALFDYGADYIRLQPYDTEGYASKAQEAFGDAVAQGSDVIIGPLFSEEVAAIYDDAIREGIPVLALSSNFNYAASNVFMLGYDPYEDAARIVRYAFEQGARRFAILASDDEYARLAETVLDIFAKENDVLVTRRLFYKGRINRVFDQINEFASFDKRDILFEQWRERLQLDVKSKEDVPVIQGLRRQIALPFDAVLLPMGGQDLLSATAFLAFSQASPPDVLFLGTSIWEDETLFGDPSLRGGWFVSTLITPRRNFQRRFRETFEQSPTRIASIVYDALSLVLNLSRTGDITVERLTLPRGYKGVNGFFRLNDKGFVERALAIYEMTKKGPRIIEQPKRELIYQGKRGGSEE